MAVLVGTIMEGKGLLEEAKTYYEEILIVNESDVVRSRCFRIHERAMAHVALSPPSPFASASFRYTFTPPSNRPRVL